MNGTDSTYGRRAQLATRGALFPGKRYKSQSALNFGASPPPPATILDATHSGERLNFFRAARPPLVRPKPSASGGGAGAALPRLGQALKLLRNGFLPTRCKPAFVDADDVVYYANRDPSAGASRKTRATCEYGDYNCTPPSPDPLGRSVKSSVKSAASMGSSSDESSAKRRCRPPMVSETKVHQDKSQLRHSRRASSIVAPSEEKDRADEEFAEYYDNHKLPACKTYLAPNVPYSAIEENDNAHGSGIYKRNRTLAEIRQLYRSTPDLSVFSDAYGNENDYGNENEDDFEFDDGSLDRDYDIVVNGLRGTIISSSSNNSNLGSSPANPARNRDSRRVHYDSSSGDGKNEVKLKNEISIIPHWCDENGSRIISPPNAYDRCYVKSAESSNDRKINSGKFYKFVGEIGEVSTSKYDNVRSSYELDETVENDSAITIDESTKEPKTPTTDSGYRSRRETPRLAPKFTFPAGIASRVSAAHNDALDELLGDVLIKLDCGGVHEKYLREFASMLFDTLIIALSYESYGIKCAACGTQNRVLLAQRRKNVAQYCAQIITRQFRRFRWSASPSPTRSQPAPPTVVIDPRYVDNPELSDIRFRVRTRLQSGPINNEEGESIKIVYAHKIVLANVSARFSAIVKASHGVAGDSDAIAGSVSIEDVPYDNFKLMLEYLYGNCTVCLARFAEMATVSERVAFLEQATKYGIESLAANCVREMRRTMNAENCTELLMRLLYIADDDDRNRQNVEKSLYSDDNLKEKENRILSDCKRSNAKNCFVTLRSAAETFALANLPHVLDARNFDQDDALRICAFVDALKARFITALLRNKLDIEDSAGSH